MQDFTLHILKNLSILVGHAYVYICRYTQQDDKIGMSLDMSLCIGILQKSFTAKYSNRLGNCYGKFLFASPHSLLDANSFQCFHNSITRMSDLYDNGASALYIQDSTRNSASKKYLNMLCSIQILLMWKAQLLAGSLTK